MLRAHDLAQTDQVIQDGFASRLLFDAHTRSFAALGGVARRGIYDNMKTAVDRVKKGKGHIVNERFATMCAHLPEDPDFCNLASGWKKNVQDSRRRIWIDAAQIKFGSFTELNAWLGLRCRELWNPDGQSNSPVYGHLKLPHLN